MDSTAAHPLVEVVVPVFNEERDVGRNIARLHAHMERTMPYSWRITIVDNGSTDSTPHVALDVAADLDRVSVVRLERKGRGRALRTAWLASSAAVVAYMDVDLSTGLGALQPLLAPLLAGDADIAIGSRLLRDSHVARGLKRELISRAYNWLLRAVFHTDFRDAQCGFKALRRDVAAHLVPLIEDDSWFFDTEMLVLAARNGLRISEIPVDWIDDNDSRVRIVSTSIEDLRGVARVARTLRRGGGRGDFTEVGRSRLDRSPCIEGTPA